ncbi:MAG: hypothetical protein GXP25_08720 [Planctomycetes bacterium]|nr:hypothetical protein [Planctomycetota bacterium]
MRVHRSLLVEELESRIAPVLVYGGTNTWGDNGSDRSYDIFVSNSGDQFVVGAFSGTVDFDPDSATTDSHSSAGQTDVFLTKYNDDGSYAWTLTFGGTDFDRGYGVTQDAFGNIYVCGGFRGTVDFDPTANEDNHTSRGNEDIFVTKITSQGFYGWTKTMGAGGDDHAWDIAISGTNNVMVTGGFHNRVDFNPGSGLDNHNSAGGFDVFLTSFSTAGSYRWTETFGGTYDDEANGMATDSGSNIYLAGYFAGTVDFNSDPNQTDELVTSNLSPDAFLTQYDDTGSYRWAVKYGDDDWEEGLAVALNAGGSPYLTGEVWGDGFVAAYDTSGNLQWSDEYGSALALGAGEDITIDPLDGVLITGQSWGNTMYIMKFDGDGTRRSDRWTGATAIGVGIDTNIEGDVFVTGWFNGNPVNLDATGGTDTYTSQGDDAYLSKYDFGVVTITGVTPLDGSATTTGGAPTQFSLTFSDDLDPTTVVLANFGLAKSGGDGIFGNGNDVVITLRPDGVPTANPVYSVLTDTATVDIDPSEIPLTEEVYRISVSGSAIRDFDGVPIDGDGDGNMGGTFTSLFYVDDTQPTNGVIVIQDNNGYTNQTIATLENLGCDDGAIGSGPGQMRFSTDGVFDTESWVPYSSTYTGVSIAGADGLKTIWVQYADRAGNQEAGPYNSDGTTLDTVAPRISTMSPLPETQQASGSINTITVTFNENRIDPATVTSSDFKIIRSNLDGIFGDGDDKNVNPTAVNVVGGGSQIEFTFATPMVDDRYQITLKGDASIKDYAGNRIDGEIQPPPIFFPSGNGSEGGNFVTTFTVGEGAQLQLTSTTSSNPLSLDFGFVTNDGAGGAVGTHTLVFKNTGFSDLDITNVALGSEPFPLDYDVSQVAAIGTLTPGQTATVDVYFDPADYTVQTDTLNFDTNENAGAGASYVIDLFGMGNNGLILNKANPTFTFTDLSGDLVTLTYSGFGSAAVTAVGGGPIVNGKDIASIYLQAADRRTRFTMEDKDPLAGGDSLTATLVQTISGTELGSFRVLNEEGTFSDTTFNLDGIYVSSFEVRGDTNNVALNITGAGELSRATIRGNATNTNIIVGTDAKMIQIYENATSCQFQTNNGDLSKLMVTGDLITSQVFIGTVAGEGNMVQIRGNVAGSTIQSLNGGLRQVSISGNLSGASTINIATAGNGVRISGDMSGSNIVSGGDLKQVSVRGSMSGSNVTIGGNATNVRVTGAVTGSNINANQIKTFMAGSLNTTYVWTNVGALFNARCMGDMVDSRFFSPVDASQFYVRGDLTDNNGVGQDVPFEVTGALKKVFVMGSIVGSPADDVATVTGDLSSAMFATGKGTTVNDLTVTVGGLLNQFRVRGTVTNLTLNANGTDVRNVQFQDMVTNADINIAGNLIGNLSFTGDVTGSTIDILGTTKGIQARGQVDSTAITLTGDVGKIDVKGGMDNGTTVDVLVGVTSMAKFSGGLDNIALTFNGLADKLYLYGGALYPGVTNTVVNATAGVNRLYTSGGLGAGTVITATGDASIVSLKNGASGGALVTINGNVGSFDIKGNVDGAATNLHVTGTTGKFTVTEAISGAATIDLDGDVTQATIQGAKGASSMTGGSVITFGRDLTKSLSVKGTVEAGCTIDITRSAAPGGANTKATITGNLDGSLLAETFGDVTITGSFGGQIGDGGTFAGVGNTLKVSVPGGGGTVVFLPAFQFYQGYP